MAMTAGVKDELSRLPVTKPCCRRAEMAALLRFAGGLHLVSGRVVVEAELDTGSAARRQHGLVTGRRLSSSLTPAVMAIVAVSPARPRAHATVSHPHGAQSSARRNAAANSAGSCRGLPSGAATEA